MTAVNYDKLGYKDLKVTFEGGVVVALINRAKQRNTFGGSLLKEIIELFDLCDRDDNVRVVILTAEASAPAYCAGADISGGWDGLTTATDKKEGAFSHRDNGGTVALAIYRCRKITIAAVNGHAAGAGLTALQLPFDIRFVWSGAKLTFPFVRRGIAAEATSSYLLPRLIGHAKANYLLLTGLTVSPESHAVKDLYHQFFPTREEVFPAALALAKDLAANTSQLGVAWTKSLLQHPGKSAEENHLYDSRAIESLSKGPDAREGALAFMERRQPKFNGKLSEFESPAWKWWTPVDVKHRLTKL